MLELNICNLLNTLPKPPWTKPMNWNLHMTYSGEEYIPFNLYVQSAAVQTNSPSQPTPFPKFSQLPAELQIRVLALCSAPTLYQAMRTSSLRVEATKLFWAKSNTYYLVDASWLLDGGHSGHTVYDLSFMAYVRNVEIMYSIDCDREINPVLDGIPNLQHHIIRGFWKMFQIRFPRLKRVVINQSYLRLKDDSLNNAPVTRSIGALIEAHPVGVDVSAFVRTMSEPGSPVATVTPIVNKPQRLCFRLAPNGEWENITASSFFEHKRVTMPPKQYRGPVGEFMGFVNESGMIWDQIRGLGALAIEAIDRHHFDGERSDPKPFSCPIPRCNVYFEKPGHWTQHAAETHSDELSSETFFHVLPGTLQRDFVERSKELEQQRVEQRVKWKKTCDEYTNEGIERRRDLERRWAEQLENDQEWGSGMEPRRSRPWELFVHLTNARYMLD